MARLSLPDTAGKWVSKDLDLVLASGANAVSLHGLVDGYEGITLDHLELVSP